MEKSNLIRLIIAATLALSIIGCGDGGGGTTDASTQDSSTPDGSTDGSIDGGLDCIENPSVTQAAATATTDLQFLNQCTTSQSRTFDNTARILHPSYVPGGPYPAF